MISMKTKKKGDYSNVSVRDHISFSFLKVFFWFNGQLGPRSTASRRGILAAFDTVGSFKIYKGKSKLM